MIVVIELLLETDTEFALLLWRSWLPVWHDSRVLESASWKSATGATDQHEFMILQLYLPTGVTNEA